jgi:hypothetical protein
VMGVGYPSFFVFGACVSLASCFLWKKFFGNN